MSFSGADVVARSASLSMRRSSGVNAQGFEPNVFTCLLQTRDKGGRPGRHHLLFLDKI